MSEEDTVKSGCPVTAPVDNINIKALNQQFFQPVAEMTLGNVVKSRETSLSSFHIRKVNYGHPLFQGIFERGKTQFKSPRIF